MPPEAVALGIKPPEPMSTIGSMLNLANTAQQIQAGAVGIQQRETELQRSRTLLTQEQMDLQERNALRGLQTRLGDFRTQDGSPDYQRLTQAALEAAPKLGSEWVQKIAQTHLQGLAADSGLLKLSQEARSDLGNIVMSVADLPYVDQEKTIKAYVNQNPAKQWLSPWLNVVLPQLKNAGEDPNARRQAAFVVARNTMSPEAQRTAITPQGPTMDTGQQSIMVNTNPMAGPVNSPVTAVQKVIAPGQTETRGQDALGRPVIETRDNAGRIDYKAPRGSNYRPMMTLPTGETAQTAQALFALRDKAQADAALVPAQHFNNQQILSLTSDAFTGTGAGKLAKVLNSVLLPFKNDAAADTAQLQHFLAQQIQNNAAAQGANTDAARALAERAVLPTESPEKATKAITRINDAYASGVELFNQGLVSAINSPGNQKDIFAARDFQNAWSANFDPRIMMLENAAKSNDKTEIARIKAQLGPNGMAELLRKAKVLQRLINGA